MLRHLPRLLLLYTCYLSIGQSKLHSLLESEAAPYDNKLCPAPPCLLGYLGGMGCSVLLAKQLNFLLHDGGEGRAQE